jgi:hypothetical protein
MSNVSGAQAQPVALSTNKARGGGDTTCATFLASDLLALFSLSLSWACSLASALTDTGPLFSPRHPCQNGFEVAGYERGA